MDEGGVTGFRREVSLLSPCLSCQVGHIYASSVLQLFYLLMLIFSHHLSCDPVLEVCRGGLAAVNTWLGDLRCGRIAYLLGIRRRERDELRAETVKQMKELKDRLSGVLESFRSDKRFV